MKKDIWTRLSTVLARETDVVSKLRIEQTTSDTDVLSVLICRQPVLICRFILERSRIYRKVMINSKTTAIGLILVVVIGLGIVGVMLYSYSVPPPQEPPGEEPETVIKDGLEAWAKAIYSQDFMPAIPEEGPPFYTIIWLNVTNTGNTTITNFHAVRATIYFYNTSQELATLDLTSNIQYFVWPQIGPEESVVFEFTNVRDSIFSPTIEEGAILYSRVLATWETGSEMILTTPPSALFYTH
jgi:hypothetical protein